MDAVGERLAQVRSRIGADVTIVAVTKGFGPDAVQAALDAGVADIGENYAQELLAKAAAVDGARWHFLGRVQRNKVAALQPHVALWQGVDRAVVPAGSRALVQVNLSGLAQRNGVPWDDAPALVEELANAGVEVHGLMGVADERGDVAAQFRRLAALAGDLGLPELSMGMSGDYEIAVAEGSTMVRLGTALFGPRPVRPDLRR
jgi:uncharacterized pyridoxal phosphate-containing UPF0001 family protein